MYRIRFSYPCVAALVLFVAAQLSCGTEKQMPATPWQLEGAGSADYVVLLDSVVKRSGRFAAHIESRPVDAPGYFMLKQGIRADRYRGKRVKLTGCMKASELDADAKLFLRAQWPEAQWVAAMDSHPLVSGTMDWTSVAITLDVPSSAQALWFGVVLSGRGHLWLDDLHLEIDTSAGPSSRAVSAPEAEGAALPLEPSAMDFETPGLVLPTLPGHPIPAATPPRPLTARGIANLSALAQLVADIRFFHADPRTVTVHWDEVSRDGVELVEGAPSADSLARALQAFVTPFSTNVKVVPASSTGEEIAQWQPVPKTGDGMLWWQHRGVGLGMGSVYSSLLRWTRLSVTDTSRDVPNPRRPFVARLPGGVAALIPLSLFAPRPSPLADTVRAMDRGWAIRLSSPRDRSTRLAAVMLAWGVLQHFYPYFNVVKTNWPAQLPLALSRAARDGGSAQFGVTLRSMIAALRDGHATVLGPGLDRPRSFPFQWDWIEGQLVVTCVGDSSQTQLRRGDIIYRIDLVPTVQALRSAEDLVSGATPQWRRVRALRDLRSGPRGSRATLGVHRDGATRDVVQERLPGGACEPALKAVTALAPNVVYVDLRRVTDSEVMAAMPELTAARAVLFDLRGYPRPTDAPAILAHLTDSPIRSARLEIPIMSRPDGKGVRFDDVSWEKPPARPRIHARAVFLTDGRAISYAETTLGLVEGFKLGAIVGGPTAGTNGNVIQFRVPGGYTIAFTGMRVRKQDGSTHHGVGIRSTVWAHQTLRGVREGRDDVLEAALRLVTGTRSGPE